MEGKQERRRSSGRSRVMLSIGSDTSIASDTASFVKSPPLSADAVPLPPDGGWGWVVVLASFSCNLILDGIAYTFGVLLEPLVEHFQTDRATVSWVGSLLCGVYMLSGPLVGGLVNRFGCRPVCMSGAVVAWAAISVSVYSPNVLVLMLTYGVLGGIGLGLIYLPAIVSVGFYFESKRALATGISVCGSGVGTFLFAPIANYLVTEYGWKTSNFIFGATCLLCLLCGAAMRPLQLEVVPAEVEEEEITLPDGTKVPAGGNKRPSFKGLPPIRSVLTMPKISEEEEALQENIMGSDCEEDDEPMKMRGFSKQCSVDSTYLQQKRARRRNDSERMPALGVREGGMRHNASTPHLRPARRESAAAVVARRESCASFRGGADIEPRAGLPRPMSRKDIFYTGSIRNLVEEEEAAGPLGPGGLRPNRQSYISLRRGSSTVMPRNSLVDPVKEEVVKEQEDGLLMSMLSSMADPRLLKDPKFLLICVSNTFGFLGFYVPFVYLPSLAAGHEGISQDQGAFLLSVVGISNTLGRLVSGWLSDFAWVDSLFVISCSLTVSSVCVFLFPFVTTYEMLLLLGALFGLSIAAYISLTSIVLVDLIGLERLTSAFGLLTMFRGAASIVGPPIAGAVYEATESLDISFFLAGSFLLAAGLTSVLADVVRRRQAADSV